MTFTGTTAGPELLVGLDREAGGLRAQLEAQLREAIRAGRLAAGARMPASRTLAADLGVSRRLVVEAYAQLIAERWLEARTGSGTFVARDAAGYAVPATPPAPGPPRYDFFPGSPALGAFPRGAWARALREAVRELPDPRLGYGDIRGTAEAREELAAYLRRARAVTATADAVLTCAGTTGGLALVAAVLVRTGRRRVAVEDPSLPHLRALIEAAGAETVGVPVDHQGIDVGALARTGADAVMVTPGHQFPTGVALGPERRGALVEWARGGRVVIEDDYNAEFRYDRPAVGALQGLAPDRVVYLGSASKVLAPALRLGWLVAPADLAGPLAQAKLYAGHGPGALEEHALAAVLRRGEFDRHLRLARRLYRARRAALVAALARELPEAEVIGVPGGVHAPVRLAAPFDAEALVAAARARDVGISPLTWFSAERPAVTDTLVLGYGNLAEPAIADGVRRLAGALTEVAARDS